MGRRRGSRRTCWLPGELEQARVANTRLRVDSLRVARDLSAVRVAADAQRSRRRVFSQLPRPGDASARLSPCITFHSAIEFLRPQCSCPPRRLASLQPGPPPRGPGSVPQGESLATAHGARTAPCRPSALLRQRATGFAASSSVDSRRPIGHCDGRPTLKSGPDRLPPRRDRRGWRRSSGRGSAPCRSGCSFTSRAIGSRKGTSPTAASRSARASPESCSWPRCADHLIPLSPARSRLPVRTSSTSFASRGRAVASSSPATG
jgi:hypothetical protein